MPAEEFRPWLIARMRQFAKDFASKNRLILREEHLDSDIDLAIDAVIDYYNITPPPLWESPIEAKDYPSMNLMRKGVMVELLYSECFLRARNDLNYNDGSLSINDDAKLQDYSHLIQLLEPQYKQEVKDYKASVNIARAMSGLTSPYATLYKAYLNYFSQGRG